MKKIIFILFGILLLTSCNNSMSVPDDANVYIVDEAYVIADDVVFYLRDIDEPIAIPVVNCLDGTEFSKGTIVLINEDMHVTRVTGDHTTDFMWVGIAVVIILLLVAIKKSKVKK